MKIISLRISENEGNLFKKYAEMNGLTISEFLRETAMERIEEDYDLKAYNKAVELYKANPKTFSHEQVCGMLEVD